MGPVQQESIPSGQENPCLWACVLVLRPLASVLLQLQGTTCAQGDRSVCDSALAPSHRHSDTESPQRPSKRTGARRPTSRNVFISQSPMFGDA
ncbi:hypothetical protein WMY93_004481 [Mugilogobius chulae]|uniref:Secreted protein n=1 Tax=Mugilogobius chulae TaxID=88201 RepID=A0AAW0PUZ6_9GOBI